MKNPSKELILALGFLALLLLPMLGLTQCSNTPAEKMTEENIPAIPMGLYLNTYIELEFTLAPTSLSLIINGSPIVLQTEPSKRFYTAEQMILSLGVEQTYLLKVELPDSSTSQALKIRVEPDGLRHREQVLWIDESLSEELKFSWK